MAEIEHMEYGVGVFILSLALGLFFRTYLSHALHLPYTVLLLLFGLFFGGLHKMFTILPDEHNNWDDSFGWSLRHWIEIPPEALLYTFLPILIFESAFAMDVHIFSRELKQVLTLAVPGVILATVLTAAVGRYLFPYGWGWDLALLFGAMMSATDPVAVVALLKELGVSERLGTLIEGESLLNDGTAYVIFLVFLHAVTGEAEATPAEVVKTGARLALGGPVVGAAVGYLGSTLVGYVLNDPLSEITVTVVVCFAAFVVPEGTDLHVSGILSVVAAGLVFSLNGRGRVSAQVEEALHGFWQMLGHVANTVIFFVSGLIVSDVVVRNGSVVGRREWGYLLVLYLLLQLIRLANVACCAPVLMRGRYGVGARQLAVISWGGLRGAVGLILALVFAEHAADEGAAHRLLEGATTAAEEEDSSGELSLEDNAQLVLFYMAGIALLTLTINGSTTGALLHALHLDRSSKAETELFVCACAALEAKTEHIVQVLKGDRMVGDADFKMVWRYIPVLTAKTYWHRVRAGHVELCEEERADIRANWDRTSRAHRVWRWLLHRFCEPLVARKYQNVPPRLRATWKHYHKAFRLDEHDVDRVVETNRYNARLANLGQGLVAAHRGHSASADAADGAEDGAGGGGGGHGRVRSYTYAGGGGGGDGGGGGALSPAARAVARTRRTSAAGDEGAAARAGIGLGVPPERRRTISRTDPLYNSEHAIFKFEAAPPASPPGPRGRARGATLDLTGQTSTGDLQELASQPLASEAAAALGEPDGSHTPEPAVPEEVYEPLRPVAEGGGEEGSDAASSSAAAASPPRAADSAAPGGFLGRLFGGGGGGGGSGGRRGGAAAAAAAGAPTGEEEAKEETKEAFPFGGGEAVPPLPAVPAKQGAQPPPGVSFRTTEGDVVRPGKEEAPPRTPAPRRRARAVTFGEIEPPPAATGSGGGGGGGGGGGAATAAAAGAEGAAAACPVVDHREQCAAFYRKKKALIRELAALDEDLLKAEGEALRAQQEAAGKGPGTSPFPGGGGEISEDLDGMTFGDDPDRRAEQLINNMTLHNHRTIRQKLAAGRGLTKSAQKHHENTLEEARMRLLHGYKAQFEDRFRRGWLTHTTLRILLDAIDNQLDTCEHPLHLWEAVASSATLSTKTLDLAARLRTFKPVRGLVSHFMSYKLGHLFELAANYIKAAEDIDVLDVVQAGPVANELALESLVQVRGAREALRTHLPVFAEIARAMKTRVTARYLLVKQRELVEEFYHTGHVNEKETEQLLHEIDRARIKLDYHPVTDKFLPRLALIGHLPFLRRLRPAERERFLDQADFVEEEFHAQGEVLIKEGMTKALQGRPPPAHGDMSGLKAGFYVVVRGSVRQTLYRSGGEKTERLLHAGTVFGLDDQLLGIPYKATYQAASFCHCFFFNSERVFAEAERNPLLGEGVWFTLAVSCARHLQRFRHLDIRQLYEVMQDAPFHDLRGGVGDVGEAALRAAGRSEADIHQLFGGSQRNSTPLLSKLRRNVSQGSLHGAVASNSNLQGLGEDGTETVTFDVQPGSEILLLRGKMLGTDRTEEVKAVGLIHDLSGPTRFTDHTILFELTPELLARLERSRREADVHQRLHVGHDRRRVTARTARAGLSLGRAKELREVPHAPRDNAKRGRAQRDLEMARAALEAGPTTSPRATIHGSLRDGGAGAGRAASFAPRRGGSFSLGATASRWQMEAARQRTRTDSLDPTQPLGGGGDGGGGGAPALRRAKTAGVDDLLDEVAAAGSRGLRARYQVARPSHDADSIRTGSGNPSIRYDAGSIRGKELNFSMFKGRRQRSQTEIGAALGLAEVPADLLQDGGDRSRSIPGVGVHRVTKGSLGKEPGARRKRVKEGAKRLSTLILGPGAGGSGGGGGGGHHPSAPPSEASLHDRVDIRDLEGMDDGGGGYLPGGGGGAGGGTADENTGDAGADPSDRPVLLAEQSMYISGDK